MGVMWIVSSAIQTERDSSSFMGLKSAGILAVLALVIPSASMVLSRRRSAEHNRGREEADDAFTDRLYPFIDDSSAPPNYPGLWSAIGGIAGVLRMNRESIKAIGIARGLRKADPEYTHLPSKEVFWTAVCLWFITLICLAEAFPIAKSKSRPHIVSLWCARLYCEMKGTLESLKEFRDRSAKAKI